MTPTATELEPGGSALVAAWSPAWRDALPVRSAEEEARLLDEAGRAVAELQAAARGDAPAAHALHPRGIHATTRATLRIGASLPEKLRLGPLQPGASWPAVVRLSSANPRAQPDEAPDQRGLAVRIADGERRLDLLATTGEAHHARDAEAMIASLRAAAAAVRGGAAGRLGALARLLRALGVRDGLRMARTVSRARQAGVSLAALTFYSRAPFQLGPFAVRYRFAPEPSADAALRGAGADALRHDLLARLRQGPVRWTLELQGFLDATRTPLADHRVPWDSPWLQVGALVLDPHETDEREELAENGTAPAIAGFRVHPDWPDPAGAVFLPLGDLNLLRGAAYEASQAGRSRMPGATGGRKIGE